MPEAPFNGNITLDNGQTLLGSTASYSCNEGYTLVRGSTTRVCEVNGWTGEKPYCMKDCGQLPDLEYGMVSQSGTSINAESEYKCNHQYILNGPQSRYCLSGGNWSGTAPDIVAKHHK